MLVPPSVCDKGELGMIATNSSKGYRSDWIEQSLQLAGGVWHHTHWLTRYWLECGLHTIQVTCTLLASNCTWHQSWDTLRRGYSLGTMLVPVWQRWGK